MNNKNEIVSALLVKLLKQYKINIIYYKFRTGILAITKEL